MSILGVEIELPNKKNLYFFTTHLQAKRKDRHNKVKIKQLKEAKEVINKLSNNMKNGPVILAGDFNLSEEKTADTLKEAREIFPGMTDTFDLTKGEKLKASTWDSLSKNGAHKIDHMWVINSKIKGFSYISKYFGKEVSGHLAQFSEFDLKTIQ